MHIVYCLAGTFNSGGMERIVISKANWFAAHGHEVSIVTTEQAGRSDFFPLNEKIVRKDLDIMYSKTNGLSPIAKFRARKLRMKWHRKKLETFLFDVRPDITISTFGNEIGFLPDIKDGSKKIAEIHFCRWFRMQLHRQGLWKWIDRILSWQDKKALSRYDKFICLTKEDMANWHGIKNIAMIPNFITDIVPAPASLSEKSMIAVGRLSYQKGYERLIAAGAIVNRRYPNWKLNIYGGGELQADLQQQITALKLDGVVNLNPPVKDIQVEYLKHSALVLSSRYEGMPMVLLEAMACGLPLISYTCQCGPKDLIRDEYNGLLVPEGDVDGLAQAIMRVIEDEKLRKRMGANALEESKRYLQDAIMPRWENLLYNLLTTSRSDG